MHKPVFKNALIKSHYYRKNRSQSVILASF